MCQFPFAVGYPAHIGARLKRPAYCLNGAPLRLRNRLDTSLRGYGMIPTRVDRCCYIYNSQIRQKSGGCIVSNVLFDSPEQSGRAIESLTDPISRSPSHGKTVSGIICVHVDNLLCMCDQELYRSVVTSLSKDFQIGVEDTNGFLCLGQRFCWKTESSKSFIQVDPMKWDKFILRKKTSRRSAT